MLARDLGLGRAERDLLSTEPRIEEITARGSPDKILTSRLTDDAPFRGERTRSSWMSGPRAGNGTRVLPAGVGVRDSAFYRPMPNRLGIAG